MPPQSAFTLGACVGGLAAMLFAAWILGLQNAQDHQRQKGARVQADGFDPGDEIPCYLPPAGWQPTSAREAAEVCDIPTCPGSVVFRPDGTSYCRTCARVAYANPVAFLRSMGFIREVP